jgi:hypothetical protein
MIQAAQGSTNLARQNSLTATERTDSNEEQVPAVENLSAK